MARSFLVFHSAPVGNPGDVSGIGANRNREARGVFQHVSFGGGREPFFNLGMAISKGKSTRAIMVRGREIAPHGAFAWIGGVAKNEPAVIDAIGMLVQEDKDACRLAEIAGLQKLPPKRINRAAVAFITDEGVHRETPGSGTGVGRHDISGALEYPEAFGDVRPQFSLFN